MSLAIAEPAETDDLPTHARRYSRAARAKTRIEGIIDGQPAIPPHKLRELAQLLLDAADRQEQQGLGLNAQPPRTMARAQGTLPCTRGGCAVNPCPECDDRNWNDQGCMTCGLEFFPPSEVYQAASTAPLEQRIAGLS